MRFGAGVLLLPFHFDLKNPLVSTMYAEASTLKLEHDVDDKLGYLQGFVSYYAGFGKTGLHVYSYELELELGELFQSN